MGKRSSFTGSSIGGTDSASSRDGSRPAKGTYEENPETSQQTNALFSALVISLIVAVVVCSTSAFILLRNSEEEVGRQTYESIAAAALSGAQATTRRKLQGSEVMATLLSQMLPNEADWPLVDIPGYIPMAAKVAELSSSNTQALMVFLDPNEVTGYEEHVKQVYIDQGRPEGTGYNDFGFGVWRPDPNDPKTYEDGRIPDPSGTTDWGGKYEMLAPLTLHNVPGAGSLLYNVYSQANRGIHLDAMIECVDRFVEEQENLGINTTTVGPKCPVVTDMLVLQIRPGPAGLLFQPIFPANNPTAIVGFATTSIHWQQVLEAVVPDYVSGLTCVVNTATSTYTYEILNGKPELVGDGDLHDRKYTGFGRAVILNDIETGTSTSAVYTLTVYPTEKIFAPFESNSPLAVAFGFAFAILLVAFLFGLYDFLMRREAKERKEVVNQLVRENRRKANENVWLVKRKELHFEDPAEILGQGTFGLVLLAQYRGTSVAVKRVLPPREGNIEGKQQYMLASMYQSTLVEATTKAPTADSTSSWGGIQFSASGAMGTYLKNKSAANKEETIDFEHLQQEFIEEMRYLSRLRHPCVTTVMGAVLGDGEEPMLVLEYMEHGSLHDLLHNETMAIDGDIALPILRDISQGMRFLHAATPQVIHGDLKANNILVDKRFRAKVADFGLSQKQKIGGTGTPFWMAPELLRVESTNTSATDVFSFGVILYEVYSRKDPYHGEDPEEVLRGIMDREICKRVQAPKNMPPPIRLLMEDCLQDDPEKRPSFEEIDLRLKRIDAETANPADMKGTSQVSLFDIFPRHIAEALRDGRKVEAEQKEIVTIFFSDIVGFTEISSRLDPRKVAKMLDRLYSKLDTLTTKYDLYKIETIGDAFMAATNLVKDQSSDHCKRVAQFSIEAIEVANETLIDEDDPSAGHINLRVGFHSGPVVADVVGHRNPRYCLFGDAVNTASRMESNSANNCINCSEQSAEILKSQWPEVRLIDRGEIWIKGKGMMRCSWVHTVGPTGTDQQVQENPGLRGLLTKAPSLAHVLDRSNRSQILDLSNRSQEEFPSKAPSQKMNSSRRGLLTRIASKSRVTKPQENQEENSGLRGFLTRVPSLVQRRPPAKQVTAAGTIVAVDNEEYIDVEANGTD